MIKLNTDEKLYIKQNEVLLAEQKAREKELYVAAETGKEILRCNTLLLKYSRQRGKAMFAVYFRWRKMKGLK